MEREILDFAELVRQHQTMVFSLALHFLRDRELAEELAQEVFLQLHANLRDIESPSHAVFWLRRVTHHRCIDESRKRKLRPSVPLDQAPEPAACSPAADPILSNKLRALVATLPDAARSALILRYQEDLDPVEIAHLLGIPLSTVKSHLHRSLAVLREKLLRMRREVVHGSGT